MTMTSESMTLPDVSSQLDYEHENKRDFIVDTKTIKILPHPHGLEWPLQVYFVDNTRRKSRTFNYEVTHHTLTQIAAHTNVPMNLIEKMVEGTEKERLEICKLLTVRLRENPMPRLIRTMASDTPLGGRARAFLSDRYRTLDNHALMQAIFPVIQEFGDKIKVHRCAVTETKFYLQLRYSAVKMKLGKVVKEGLRVDDIVQGGVTISNSEVGAGPVRVQPFFLRLVCTNGMTATVYKKGQRKIHVGKQVTSDDIVDNRLVNQTDEQFFEQVAQVIKDILGDTKFFKKLAAQFRETKTRKLRDGDAAVRVLAKLNKLNETEAELVRAHLRQGDTQFTLINAVTRAARDKGVSFDRGMELEEIGGKLVSLDDKAWRPIGNARPKAKEILG